MHASKIGDISSIRLLEKALDVGSRNRIKLLKTSSHLLNKCLHATANIVEEHTFKKCSLCAGTPLMPNISAWWALGLRWLQFLHHNQFSDVVTTFLLDIKKLIMKQELELWAQSTLKLDMWTW